MIGTASIVGKVLDPVLSAPGKLLGGVAGAAASGVMDQVTSWMTDAAKSIDGFVMHVALATTQPQLGAAWFGDLFNWLATLALPLAALFAVAGLGAAALLHNGRMLGETVYGIVRAGWGTGVAVALVVIGVAAASAVTSDIAAQIPARFFDGLSAGWGASGFGGLAASALAFVVALITVIAGVFVWLELLFRMAALYVGVGVLPLVLAAAIYPPLSGLLGSALRFLVVLLIFPVIVEVVLLIGAAVLGGGASLSGGVASAATTNMAGAMVFVMAAMSPWGTLKLVGLSGGGVRSGGGSGAAAGAAAAGATGGALVVLAGAQQVAAHTEARIDAAQGN